jgi:aminotransferase
MTTQSRNQKHRKQHISQRANAIQPSGIRKFFDLLSSIDGVISLGVGEPDYTTPWHIRESAIESIEKGQTMYTSNSGMPELRKELARFLKTEFKVDYDPTSELLITVGCSEALDLTMRALIDPGDEVIIPNPCFVAYGSCVTLAGGKPVHIPTYEANNFEISAADIEKNITNKTRAILIGYPSNPTGAVMSRQKLADIAALAGLRGRIYLFCLLTGNERAHCVSGRFLQGLCDDRLARGLCRRSQRNHRRDA